MKAKMLSAVMALSVVGWAAVATAGTVQARGPIWDDTNGRVGHTTYYSCNGNYHGALDISNGTCSVWYMRGMLVGSYFWNITGANSNCISTPQVAQNSAVVSGSNGYAFGQYHHNHHSTASRDVTCDRCALGLVGATGNAYGAHVHAQNTLNGTKVTAWYSGYATCGTKSNGNTVMGYPRMS